jgi:hypothetical protein
MMEPDWTGSDLCNSRRVGEADLQAMWSLAHSMEPVTEGWINGIKTGDHKTLKCQTSRQYSTV